MASTPQPVPVTSIEAKLVVLGAQGVSRPFSCILQYDELGDRCAGLACHQVTEQGANTLHPAPRHTPCLDFRRRDLKTHVSSLVPSLMEFVLIDALGGLQVGKTCLVQRWLNPNEPLAKPMSTVGASFVTKKIMDPVTSSVVRLQVWDT